MPSAGFEPATPETKRPQTYALDSVATPLQIIFVSTLNEIKVYQVRRHRIT
jgi:hypothetical protein